MFPNQISSAFAAEVVGAALVDLFPGVELIESEVNDLGFSVLALFPQGRHPELIPMVEERARRLMKEGISFQKMEMICTNAADFFHALEQPLLADRAMESEEQTVHVIRYQRFADFPPIVVGHFPLEHPFLHIKIFQVEGEGKELKLQGAAFEDKEALKAFSKEREKARKAEKGNRLVQKGWMTEEGYLLPLGIAESETVKKSWRQLIQDRGLTEVSTQSMDEVGLDEAHLILAQQFRSGVAEWAVGGEMQDFSSVLASPEQALALCISSLQFIQETAKILELDVEWIAEFQQSPDVPKKEWTQGVEFLKQALSSLCLHHEESLRLPSGLEPSVTGAVTDACGNRWRLPFLSVSFSQEKRQVRLRFSLLGPLRRFLALRAEKESAL